MTRKQRLSLFFCLPLATSLLVGCATTIPPVQTYNRPAPAVPATLPGTVGATANPAGEQAFAKLPWREYFVDGQLQKLIEVALANNRDLRISALNIERTRALHQIRKADLWPKFDGSAGINFQQLPEDFSGNGKVKQLEQYTVGLGISSYELDFFGRVKSLKEQALDQFLASEQARRALQISLVAQVASGYLTLASDRERLQLAEETLANQQASYQLTEKRLRAGVVTALALSQAQSSVEAAKVEIGRYKSLVAQDENGLALLLGEPLPPELSPTTFSENLTSIKEVRGGLSSEVLLDRPDILQAEKLLQGYQANINAARAAFFPRITLVSSVGFGSGQLSDLLSKGSFAWNFTPKVTLPIFDAGITQANFKVAEIDRDLAVLQYDKVIQSAFREVADGLAQLATISEQMYAQQALVNANSESLRLSQARFAQGVDNYLSVLDSQRACYSAKQNLINLRQARLTNLVTLYKVLGGGAC